VEEIDPTVRDALALWFEVPEDSFDVVIESTVVSEQADDEHDLGPAAA